MVRLSLSHHVPDVVLFPGADLKEFKKFALKESYIQEKMANLKERVNNFMSAFPMPGESD